MYRIGLTLVLGLAAMGISGCGGEDQPNAPAKASEVNEDFAKKTADMMKNANSSMDPKKAKGPAPGPAACPPLPAVLPLPRPSDPPRSIPPVGSPRSLLNQRPEAGYAVNSRSAAKTLAEPLPHDQTAGRCVFRGALALTVSSPPSKG